MLVSNKTCLILMYIEYVGYVIKDFDILLTKFELRLIKISLKDIFIFTHKYN